MESIYKMMERMYIVVREELVTKTHVFGSREVKEGCSIKSGFNSGEFIDNFSFSARCLKTIGSFEIDFKTSEGFFGMTFLDFDATRNIPLINCRAINL